MGGGCFWCLEPVLQELRGVFEVRCGYAGGQLVRPTYEAICTGKTGHAEVVQVVFDPRVLSFPTLLDVFFCLHDPTTLNRQGNDVGTQYRSVVFCQNAVQQTDAEAAINRLDAAADRAAPVVTELADAAPFYVAEDYHQGYFRQHGHEPYCSAVIAPKVAKCRKRFAALLRQN